MMLVKTIIIDKININKITGSKNWRILAISTCCWFQHFFPYTCVVYETISISVALREGNSLTVPSNYFSFALFNTSWPNDAIWQHRSVSTLAQVMACCWKAPIHYQNQCWLVISNVQWHSSEGNFWYLSHQSNICLKIAFLNFIQISQGPTSLPIVMPLHKYFFSGNLLVKYHVLEFFWCQQYFKLTVVIIMSTDSWKMRLNLNILRPRQNGHHFTDIFKCIYWMKLYEFRLWFHWRFELTIFQHRFR